MKLIEVIAAPGAADTIAAIADQQAVPAVRRPVEALAAVGTEAAEPATAGTGTAEERAGPAPFESVQLFAADDKVQPVLDALQTVLGAYPSARAYVLPIEVALPKAAEQARRQEDEATESREALYSEAEKSTLLSTNYMLLLVLSTVVAAIGLVRDNVAVIIGAMVIAPLLGPNLALGLSTALGDLKLMRRSLTALGVGILVAVAVSASIGWLWPFPELSVELAARTQVGLDSAVLAFGSGAAAALSMTTGLSSVLVGVMVAVALLPPAATLGLTLGHGLPEAALGSGLLLAVNVACLNLACKLVLLFKGVVPRTWLEKRTARHATIVYVAVWAATLALLAGAIYFYHRLAQ